MERSAMTANGARSVSKENDTAQRHPGTALDSGSLGIENFDRGVLHMPKIRIDFTTVFKHRSIFIEIY